MPDYLFIDIAAFLAIWTVPLLWLILGMFRYMMRQHKENDSLRSRNHSLREANELLRQELERCYGNRPADEWIDALEDDVLGDDSPSEPRLEAV
jgi:hypothetical protein